MPADDFTPNADELLGHNARFSAGLDRGELGAAPTRRLAVVACMDSRMDVFRLLGLGDGEAHVIRNAGGVVTDDVIRSLCLSQRLLGSREIILLHHTDCGLQKVSDDAFRAELEAEIGVKPWWALESFTDPAADVRQSIRRLLLTPFIVHKAHIRGFVYQVRDGSLEEVELQDVEGPGRGRRSIVER